MYSTTFFFWGGGCFSPAVVGVVAVAKEGERKNDAKEDEKCRNF